MIYGYAKQVVDEEYGLLQMREVTFSMTSAELRLVAKFLARVADDIDLGRPFLHRHIKEVVPGWLPSNAQVDIVAVPPDQSLIVDDSES